MDRIKRSINAFCNENVFVVDNINEACLEKQHEMSDVVIAVVSLSLLLSLFIKFSLPVIECKTIFVSRKLVMKVFGEKKSINFLKLHHPCLLKRPSRQNKFFIKIKFF